MSDKKADLRRVVSGTVPSAKLPDKLSLSDLKMAIEELHGYCFGAPVGEQVEWGCCLAIRGATLRMPESHRVQGHMNSVAPTCAPGDDDPEHKEAYVGFAHTHTWIGDKPYPGFSCEDFRASLADGDCLALVYNGQELFGLVRTSDCTRPPQIVPDGEYEQWRRLYGRVIARAQKRPDKYAVWSSLWEANRIMCEKTGYGLYYGHHGQEDDALRLLYRPNCEVLQA